MRETKLSQEGRLSNIMLKAKHSQVRKGNKVHGDRQEYNQENGNERKKKTKKGREVAELEMGEETDT